VSQKAAAVRPVSAFAPGDLQVRDLCAERNPHRELGLAGERRRWAFDGVDDLAGVDPLQEIGVGTNGSS